MSNLGSVPSHWYKYEFPLPEVPNAPKPSNADYSPQNVAPLIEFFAGLLGKGVNEIQFVYDNNTPSDTSDDIVVSHPGDAVYSPSHRVKSEEQMRYEIAAKKSARLIMFQDNSPAGIEYFQEI